MENFKRVESVVKTGREKVKAISLAGYDASPWDQQP